MMPDLKYFSQPVGRGRKATALISTMHNNLADCSSPRLPFEAGAQLQQLQLQLQRQSEKLRQSGQRCHCASTCRLASKRIIPDFPSCCPISQAAGFANFLPQKLTSVEKLICDTNLQEGIIL